MADDWNTTQPDDIPPSVGRSEGGANLLAKVSRLPALEQHFRSVLETIGLVGLMVDAHGHILLCNDPLLRLTGWQRDAVMGQNWLQLLIAPDSRQELWGRFKAALEQREGVTHYEGEILTRSGDRRLILWHCTFLPGPDGAIDRVVSLGQDITDQRQASPLGHQREGDLRRPPVDLPGALLRYVLHPSGGGDIVGVSQGCLELWELDLDPVQGDLPPLWQAIHRDDRTAVQRLLQQSANTLTPWFCEWRIATPSGRQKWLQGMGRPERLANGDVAWDLVIFDISERVRRDAQRQQTELALVTANQQMRAFIDNTPALVNMFDVTGRYLQVNQATADQFNLSSEDLVGRSFADLLPPSVVTTFKERIQQVVTSQAPVTVEDTLDLGGEQKVFRTVLFPVGIGGNGGLVIGSVATDITPLAVAQKALRHQAEEERLICAITQHIHQSLDVDQILQTAVTEVRQFLQTDRVLIYRFAPDGSGTMVVEAVLPPWMDTLGITVEDTCFITNPALVERYRQGHTHHFDNIHQASISPCYRDLLAGFQVQANLVVPISYGGDLWGLLCVHHCRSPRHWHPAEVALLQQLANQVAIALQQGQLLAQTAAQAQQEKLLNDIIGAISDSLDLQTLMQRTTDTMLHTFKASRSIVILCQATDTELMHTATACVPGCTDLKAQPIPIEGNLHAQRILNQEAPVVVDDVTQEPDLAPMLSLAQALEIGAMLSVSIRYRGVVRGILSLHQCPNPRPWSEAEVNLIKRIADYLAIAIHQAELYTQAQTELVERERLEAQLRHDACHDRLTGLPNRVLFLERLAQAIDRLHQHCYRQSPLATAAPPLENAALAGRSAACGDCQFAVLFLDLDRFKVINDSLGHAIGDQLLQVVAQRLQTCVRPADAAARLGGDEFVVLLSDLSDAAAAISLAQRIHATLEAPVLLEGHEVFIHASIGIALSAASYTDPNQVLRDADIAMYRAKGSNREYAIFDARMHTLVMQQMELENDLRRALERSELRLHYQPIVDLATGDVQGFEALVRWQHPRRGLVQPTDFIPTAENTGLITTLDLWTLNEACRQLSAWHRRFDHSHHLAVNVNLSGKQFVRPDLIQQIDAALAHNGLQGRHLKVEITESVLIQNAQLAIALLDQLRQRHIQVCMDDFGTGYSSLSYLHRFPVDVLKIDKSFITNISSRDPSRGDYEIVKAIIGLAESLNLTVVAEGIETREQMQYLQAHQCQGGQGYYFSRPLSVAAATEFIAQLALAPGPG